MDYQMNKLEYFGKRLAECRRSHNYTQDELANRLGVTPQALSKWEKGISSPDVLMILAICDILEINGKTLNRIKTMLEMIVRDNYTEIINVDILKSLVDNLRIKYPILVEEAIPNRISYALLLDVQ